MSDKEDNITPIVGHVSWSPNYNMQDTQGIIDTARTILLLHQFRDELNKLVDWLQERLDSDQLDSYAIKYFRSEMNNLLSNKNILDRMTKELE